jgi:hypothetical protein
MRSSLSRVVLSSTERVARIVRVQTLVGAVVTDRAVYVIEAPNSIEDELPEPMRSDPGELWQATIDALGVGQSAFINASGHYE